MPPGGVAEIITYFAGHMHLTDDVVRLRDIYLDPAYQGVVGHDPTEGPQPTSVPVSDIPSSGASPFYNVPLVPDHAIGVRVPHHFMPGHHDAGFVGQQYGPDALQYAAPVLYPGYTVQLSVAAGTVTAPDAIHPQDEMVNVLQINNLSAVENLGVDKLSAFEYLGVDPNGPAASFAGEAPAQISHMLAISEGLIPDGFGALEGNQTDGISLLSTNTDALALVNEHDAALADGTATQHSQAPGEYVNGVFDPSYGTPAPEAPIFNVSTSLPAVMGNINSGLSIVAGSNSQINVAGIVSDNAEHSTLMVLGNYYSTNAIIQTNVLQDIDNIATAGPAGLAKITTGGDQLNNLANFYQHDIGQANISGEGNSSWHVNVVNGDFYDVNIVSQTNVLAGGGASFQTTQSTFYQAITGGNQQINGMLLDATGRPYNMVIVEGSYHNANIIYQNNVVLNDDVVKAILGTGTPNDAGAAATGLSVSTGGNSLTNDASIVNYGGNHFAGLSGELAAHAQGAEGGSFDPLVAHAAAGDGSGQLNVLFVTGSYYDINVVAQTNILSNSSLAMQVMHGGAPGTTATEAISTGANQAFNLAQIIDVGTSGTQFVAGQHYSDTLLVQANIVTQQATVTTADPQALAHEVIAFVGDDAFAAALPLSGDALGTGGNVHHDMMGGMLV